MVADAAPADDLLEECTEGARIALASAGRNRDVWLAALALDGRIGRMVLGASEPMLGQIRLAWWRDQLGQPASERPQGDPLLDLIGSAWNGHEISLIALVDGWEAMLGEGPVPEADLSRFIDGRAALARGLAARLGEEASAAAAERAGAFWARADIAGHAAHDAEREFALDHTLSSAPRLPRRLRPLAVIGGLARRSLRNRGAPMLGDRLSPLAALRLGLIGR